MRLAVVTGNPNKVAEVAESLSGIVELEHIPLDIPEYRDREVAPIARAKAASAWEIIRRPLIVDDTGLFIPALRGFPGPYAAYVHDTIGNEGILRLMEGKPDSSAWFETVIAYAGEDGEIRLFRGRLDGRIVPPRGSTGFGYDPIFEVGGRTLAEMDMHEKNRLSHRGRALGAFRDWILSNPSNGKD
ncbi:MAG: RdgB/HAM1 family non-canonical purine NTP pyrophosphatase [Methanoculleaceae archaeon]